MQGFYIVDKPKGCTSFDVCHKIQRKYNYKKCGHTGTLDPDTTGILVVAFNDACKLMPLLNEHEKWYEATVHLGYSTDTLDSSGKILEEIDEINIKDEDIVNIVSKLKFETKQVPPMYSSIKINGKKLYEYAREGKTVKLEPRDIKIYDLNIISITHLENSHIDIKLSMHVSKGFYVRSLARDLGDMLNIPSVMTSLRRLNCGDFKEEQATTLEDILNGVNNYLTIEEVFSYLPKVNVNDYITKLVKNGVELDERQTKIESEFMVYNNNKLIAIYKSLENGVHKPMWINKE